MAVDLDSFICKRPFLYIMHLCRSLSPRRIPKDDLTICGSGSQKRSFDAFGPCQTQHCSAMPAQLSTANADLGRIEWSRLEQVAATTETMAVPS